MLYRIEYTDGRRDSFVDSRKAVIEKLKQTKDVLIADIRKVYKNGVSDSVMDIYAQFIGGGM